MNLAAFQALFQSRVLAGAGQADAPLLETLCPSPHGAAGETLLGVYQKGYRARLAEFLAEDHPGLRALLGDDEFDVLIEDYIAARPARDPNARWYTTGLPDFMQESANWRENAPAVSMARFERAMVDAFDAADAEPLKIEALASFSPEDWPLLVFSFHPSLILLELAPGTLAAYSEDEDAEPQDTSSDDLDRAAVWRIEYETAYRALEGDEYVALCEARAGHAFGDICQMAAFQKAGEIAPERLAQCLSSWFADGMVIGATVEKRA